MRAPTDSGGHWVLLAVAAIAFGLAPQRAMADSPPDSVSVPVAPAESVQRPSVSARAGRAVGSFLSDGWTAVSSPFRLRGAGFLWLGAALGVEAALYANDQELYDAAVRNRDAAGFKTVIDVGETIEPVGFMGKTNPIYLALLGSGYAFNVPLLRTIPTEILESHLIAGGVRNVGKLVVGRRHPYEHLGPREFSFGDGTSFPSGHTSVVFELATIASMNAHYLPVTVAAYSLATTLALQRVSSGNHWPSDVFIAGVYGTLVARTVVRLHEEREKNAGRGTSLLPYFSDDGRLAGAQVIRHF